MQFIIIPLRKTCSCISVDLFPQIVFKISLIKIRPEFAKFCGGWKKFSLVGIAVLGLKDWGLRWNLRNLYCYLFNKL